MYRATGVDPTKLTACTAGWSSSASTAALPPFTRFTTPLGKPASSISSMTRCMLNGTRSDGLRMNVLPQATAYGRNHRGIIAGKLNGVMAATTPSGWRNINSSMPRATSSRL